MHLAVITNAIHSLLLHYAHRCEPKILPYNVGPTTRLTFAVSRSWKVSGL